jgi:hypothetical protein
MRKDTAMKYLPFFAMMLLALRCNSPQRIKKNEPIVSTESLGALAIDSLPSFWGNNPVVKSSSGVFFSSQKGYIGESVYTSSKAGNEWGMFCVIVFESNATAIAAMENRIKVVATVICNGDSSKANRWWYSNGPDKLLTVSKYNTLIEAIGNRGGNSFLFESDSLWIPINDISKRIDNSINGK